MLWDDFLNSDYHDWRGGDRSEDRLDKAGWLDQWLGEHHLSVTGRPTEEEMAELKRFRAFLFDLVKRLVHGSEASRDDIRTLNKLLAGGPVVRQITGSAGGYRLETQHFSTPVEWPQVMAEIAASFADVLINGEISRIRICDNPDCLWVYYDNTRNRSKRFCDDKMCGNLMKVRRFRARKKSSEI
ncbi:CGNR zinc finger domain-containing protein [Paenibacillus alkalitolerans]|uniref:CGNR zinc finger domain-containing protein n=1 Tax=Paenibacillus alkalitolerans TaxID=2799335 RepID=UPI0018F655E4|nr:ABATE domain-containing protein [Paenibacillus alkalitolerans]